MKNKITSIIENYGMLITPEEDINIAEILNIADESQTKLQAVENSYIYGYMRGCSYAGKKQLVPLYNIRQMTDDEWIALSARSKSTYRQI